MVYLFGTYAPWIILAIIGSSLIILRKDFLNIFKGHRKIKNERLILNKIVQQKNKIVSEDSIDSEIWRSGIQKAVEYVREMQPDLIIGVHPGGRMLSVYIADILGFPPGRCIFAHTEPVRSPHINITGLNQLSGKILVIDDITRSGRTLRVLKSYIESEYQSPGFKISSLEFLVLVVVDSLKKVDSFRVPMFRPDFFCYTTEEKRLELPWSILSEKIKLNFDYLNKGLEYDKSYLNIHEKMVQDFNFALSLAKFSIDDQTVFRTSVQMGTLEKGLSNRQKPKNPKDLSR